MTSGWGKGSTRQWRKIREQVLKRYAWRCQLRINGICKGRADCVHHIYGKAAGDDPANLVAACTPCNLHIGDPMRQRGNSNGNGKSKRTDPPPSSRIIWE